MSKKQFDEFVKNARTVTVEVEETTFVIREALGFDALERPHLNRIISDMMVKLRKVEHRLKLAEIDWEYISSYITTIMQTVSIKGNHNSLPETTATESDLIDGFWSFMSWSKPVMDAVRKGLRDVDQIEPSPKAKKNE